MPLNVADFPDLKLIKIYDETRSVGAGSFQVFEYVSPPNRISNIISLVGYMPNTGTFNISSITVDDVEYLVVASAGLSNNAVFVQARQEVVSGFTTNTSTYLVDTLLRRKLTVRVNNTGAVGDFRVLVWAFVHQDPLKEFGTEATLQGG